MHDATPAPDQPDQPDQPDRPDPRDDAPAPPLSGRRAEAARNDERILLAARAVFMADSNAPIAAVAERAGVGIAALYRRYPSKEALLQRLYQDGLDAFLAEIERALADPDEPWRAFRRFVHRSFEIGTGSLSYRFYGAFPWTPEMIRVDKEIDARFKQLIERCQAAGAVRPDIGIHDMTWLFLPVYAIQINDDTLNLLLRHRYLAILLDGIQTGTPSPLPGPEPNDAAYDAVGEAMFAHWDERLAKRAAPRSSPAKPGG